MSPPTSLTKEIADDLYFPKAQGCVLVEKMTTLEEGQSRIEVKLDEILDTFRVVGFVWKNKGKFITGGTITTLVAIVGYLKSIGVI